MFVALVYALVLRLKGGTKLETSLLKNQQAVRGKKKLPRRLGKLI